MFHKLNETDYLDFKKFNFKCSFARTVIIRYTRNISNISKINDNRQNSIKQLYRKL